MFSKFFINRPIFATVLSIVIIMAGVLSMRGLAVEEYPQVTPPQVMVMANYPGASAETLAKTVASPLEQAINGVDNMIYMSSTASSSGTVSLNISFETGTDPDQATINVNNRVQSALPLLPQEVQQMGVTVRKRTSTILEIIALTSDNPVHDTIFLSNYALLNIMDDLKRVEGVGDVVLFGNQEYAMRIWLKPDELAKHSISPSDIAGAIREQNSQFAPGKFAEQPYHEKTAFTYTVVTKGRFSDVGEFENIILRANSDGSHLRLKDVATIELGAGSYNFNATLNNKPMVPMAIFLQPGANALNTAEAVERKMQQVMQRFPEGMRYQVPYDTTTFVKISIQEVIKTFIEAIILVVLVIYLFLQHFRATLIPVLAVPVSIIGTFAGMYMLGFSINLLTLFGLVLAIGIVVDDAIIVIENVERTLRTRAISVKEATIEAMKEVTSPVIAIVLVLSAVFIPVALMSGFTGQMYRQFATTIVISVVISGIVALTLTPALCALLLHEKEPQPSWPLRKFNQFFDWATARFTAGVKQTIRHGLIAVLLFGGLIGISASMLQKIPTELVPSEDKGTLIAISMLPPASSLQRTEQVRNDITNTTLPNENVKDVIGLAGIDISSFSLKSSSGLSFIKLEDWSQRTRPDQHSSVLAGQFMGQLLQNPDALIFTLNPPPIMGMSMTGGFEMYVQNRTGTSYMEMNNYITQIVQKANARPELKMVRSTLDVNVPQYEVTLDREKAKSLNVSISEVFSTMQATFGSMYVNDFNMFGRTFKVYLQSDSHFRKGPESFKDVFVRSNDGHMVPLNSLLTHKRIIGPEIVERFNLFPAAKVTGEPKFGFSSGDAIRAIEEVAAEVLPEGYTLAWSGNSYQEKEMAGTGAQAFIYGIVLVFLILAALYERWLMPLAVITAVPFAVFGAIMAIWMRGLSNELYFQIGLVVLIGLSAKNAILIVEFAMQARAHGATILDSAIEAAKLRFRPIVMTSLAFTLGVVPLAISSGAGAASRHAIGTGVIGGMLAATFIAIFFIPLFYLYLAQLGEWFAKKRKGTKGESHA